jgi:hypothetical protein
VHIRHLHLGLVCSHLLWQWRKRMRRKQHDLLLEQLHCQHVRCGSGERSLPARRLGILPDRLLQRRAVRVQNKRRKLQRKFQLLHE